jgi:hypothetical protein
LRCSNLLQADRIGAGRGKPDRHGLGAACGAIGAIAALFWPHCGLAQTQSTLTARFALSLAGIEIGHGDWSVDIRKERYTAKSTGQVNGIWRLLLGSDISATTYGTAKQGHLTPSSYVANFSSDDDVDDVRIHSATAR